MRFCLQKLPSEPASNFQLQFRCDLGYWAANLLLQKAVILLLNFEGAFNKCAYSFVAQDFSLLCL